MNNENNTIDARLMLMLVDRMKNIVNGTAIRYNATNDNVVALFSVSGDYVKSTPTAIAVVVSSDDVNMVTFTTSTDELIHDFSISESVELFDTAVTVTVEDLSNLRDGDVYDIRMNTCSQTLINVSAWKQADTGNMHPSLEVYPGNFRDSNRETHNRRDTEALFDLKLEFDFGDMDETQDSTVILNVVGDIKDEIQRDPRFEDSDGCEMVIDTQVTGQNPFMSQANGNFAGSFITVEMKYRVSLKDSRKIQP